MAVQSKPAPIGPWGKATAGAAGAVLANALVYPLDLCVRLCIPPFSGLRNDANRRGGPPASRRSCRFK